MSSFSQKKIWIDATGVIRWGQQHCTGVQRVELGLCEYALAHEDLGIAVQDTVLKEYVPASEDIIGYLRLISKANSLDPDSGKTARTDQILAYPGVQIRFSDNETARRLAMAATGARARKGLRYQAAKLAFRLVFWSAAAARLAQAVARSFMRLVSPPKSAPVTDNGPILLVSHEVNREAGSDIAIMQAGLRGVIVVYDLIPVLMPELTSARFTRKMADLFERTLRKPEPVIAISHTTRSDLIHWNDTVVKAPNMPMVHVCQLNSSIQADATLDKPIDVLAGKRFALFCSTIDIRKGQYLLVACWNRLSRIIDPSLLPDLVLIGRKGTGWADLQRELTAASHIADKIHVLSGVTDPGLRWAYRNATLCMFPSKAEGWGLGVYEALAYGVPVVHTDIPILHEAAQNLMPSAPVGDVDAWTALLADLFEHSEKIEHLAEIIRTSYHPGQADDFARQVIDCLHQDGEHESPGVPTSSNPATQPTDRRS